MPEAQAGQAAEEAAAIPQAEAVQAEQAVLDVGRISGNISQAAEIAFSQGEISNGVSMSVVPTAADVLGGVASYRVFAWGTKADGTVVPQTSPIMGTVVSAAGGADFSLELDYGTWSVRADALNGAGKVVLSQTQENVEISAASPLVSLNFKVTYYQDASVPGAFALPISFDTGAGITSVNYSLTSSNGTNISSASPYDLTSCGGSFTLDSSVNPAFASITPANCDLVLEFLDSSNALIIRLDQSVQIYSNITTNKIDGTAPYISASGGSAAISITNAVIKSYHDSSVYVGGVGAVSGTPASDANSGTQFDPVEHLSRALEILDASAAVLNPTDGFKIYLQGDAALTADLALNKSYKLSIIGTNSTAHSYYKIDGGQNYGITSSMSALACKYVAFDKIKGWVVSAGQAEFINCDITNGRIKTGTNGGAGLCVNGSGAKAVLKNCSISGCSTDEFGGAIYVQDDSSTATAQVELTDCVIGEEGGSCATASVYSNFAYLGGGGINVGDHGKAVLANTKIFYNSAGGNSTGGGIRCNGGTLEIDGGQINHNYAASGGGGIWSDGTVTINGCAVGELSAAAPATASDCGNYSNLTGGGGIELEGGTFESASGLSVIKNYSPKKGGGININGAASLTLSGAAISHNASASSGGGVCAASTTAHFSITGGAVNNNKANNGGGLSLETQSGASPTISGVEVKGNEASGNGGGIQVTTGKYLTITGACDISGNDAANGGGISAAGKVTIESGTISGNTATAEGGGVYINSTTALFKFQDGTISGNTATGDGGGLYACGGGTMLMSGSAVIGDKNAASYATETAHSNKAQNGGGIAVDNASVYIGYTTTSSPQDAFEGGIYHNFAQAGGGGVYMGDESATKLYLYKGNVDKNCAITFGGGAICCGHAGELVINKTVISGNVAAWYGGGIAIGDENASSAAITIEDALIQENSVVAAGSKEGGAIRAAGYASFELKGSVSIPAGVGGTTGPGKNDVWLATGKSITIGSSLSATATPVATITPAAYSPGTTVLVDDGTGTLVTSEISKFAVTPESEDSEWTIGINSSGGTPVGVLTTAAIFVNGTSGHDDSTATGSKTKPYKTVSYALGKVTAPNCSILIQADTTETAALATPAAYPGLAIKSADTDKKTITGTPSLDIHFAAAATVSKVTFSTWSGVNVDENVATVELGDVAITNCSGVAGGGLWLGNGSKVTAQNLTVNNCSSSASGGGIYVNSSATLSVDGLVLQGCHADSANCDGGGISNSGTVNLRQAKISGCSASRHGAGIFNANNATLILDGECDIPSGIYLTGGSGSGGTAAKPLYIKGPYFALADGAGKIPLEPDIRTGTDEFQENSAVIKGWEPAGGGAYSVKEEQVNCFVTAGTTLSLEYAATPTPCGKLVDYSIAGGITISLGGNISFVISVPTASNNKAAFVVKDSSSGSPVEVAPTSARIEILQYGTAIYQADAQGVTATYLAPGDYELYCKAVVGGLVYDKTLAFTIGDMTPYYKPLTLEAAEAGAVVTFVNKAHDIVTYKVNGSVSQTIESGDSAAIPLAAVGDKVEFYGDNVNYARDSTYYSNIMCDKDCYIYGNIMSLVDSSTFANANELPNGLYTFSWLFYNNTHIKNKVGEQLLLPAIKLAANCYENMFAGCTGLTIAPALPATNLIYGACYSNMFRGCNGLTVAPDLPATTLANFCYQQMFNGCIGLTVAPTLPATNLVDCCYQGMFKGCANLTSVTCLATNISASSCTTDWLYGVAATGIFTKSAGMTGWPSGSDGIPSGWTVQNKP